MYIVIWYFNNEMYIIPSEGHDITDSDGNILGYVIGDVEVDSLKKLARR